MTPLIRLATALCATAALAAPRWQIASSTLPSPHACHTATALSDGRVLVAGGTAGASCADAALGTAARYDPLGNAWSATAPMSTARVGHTATLLRSGRVLVVGGRDGTGAATSTAELFDPRTGAWTAAASTAQAHVDHRAVALGDGTVLIIAGAGTAECELFDPATGRWLSAGALPSPRGRVAAALLPDGRVLVTGGSENNASPIADAHLWAPNTRQWSPARALMVPRAGHTLTVLRDGRVLAVGPDASTELYDPAANAWTPGGGSLLLRMESTASRLTDGRVLVANGPNAELFDPSTGLLADVTTPGLPRLSATATVLPTARVLLAGGFIGGAASATADLVDATEPSWLANAPALVSRDDEAVKLLPDGRVLVAGGNFCCNNAPGFADAAMFDPASGTWQALPPLGEPREAPIAVLLLDGQVLIAGGSLGSATSELFDPKGGTFHGMAPMAHVHHRGAGRLLPDGRVLVAGGNDSAGVCETVAELYTPSTNSWQSAAPMNMPRCWYTSLVLLRDGRVLAIGHGANSNSSDVFDPATGMWTALPPIPDPHTGPGAMLLLDGRVLAAGGNYTGATLGAASVFDPATSTWSAAWPMNVPRAVFGVTLLMSGGVLASGGDGETVTHASTEVFEPVTGTWHDLAPLPATRTRHTSVRLPDGRAMLAGGNAEATAGFLDEGRGAAPSWAPVLLPLGGAALPGATVTFAGSGFTALDGTPPVLRLEREDNHDVSFAFVSEWSEGSATAALPARLHFGWYDVHMVVGGVPSARQPLLVAETPATPDGGMGLHWRGVRCGCSGAPGDTLLVAITALLIWLRRAAIKRPAASAATEAQRWRGSAPWRARKLRRLARDVRR